MDILNLRDKIFSILKNYLYFLIQKKINNIRYSR